MVHHGPAHRSDRHVRQRTDIELHRHVLSDINDGAVGNGTNRLIGIGKDQSQCRDAASEGGLQSSMVWIRMERRCRLVRSTDSLNQECHQCRGINLCYVEPKETEQQQ
jgi:hypothetical protein